MGYAVMGTASASGAKRTIEAAQKAIASPLLEAGAIDGARGILINITGSTSLKLAEVQQACSIIQSAAHEDANIIFGAVLDEKMKDEVKITVIATGFKNDHPQRREKTMGAAAAAISTSRTTSSLVSSVPQVTMRERSAPVNGYSDIEEEILEPVGVAAPSAASRAAAPARDSISLDAVRNSVNGISDDDLDVPAFMRKRT